MNINKDNNKIEDNKTFTFLLPLDATPAQKHRLDKFLKIITNVYNELVPKVLERHHEMSDTEEYRQIMNQLYSLKGMVTSSLERKLQRLRVKYGLNESSIYDLGYHTIKNYRTEIPLPLLKSTLKDLYTDYLQRGATLCIKSSDGQHPKDCIFNVLNDYSKTSIYLNKDNTLLNISKMKVNLRNKEKTDFETRALNREVEHYSIVRKFIRGKFKYYLLVTVKGLPPTKFKYKYDEGTIGVDIDIDNDCIAITSPKRMEYKSIFADYNKLVEKKNNVSSKIQSSLIANNPNNYTKTGRVRKNVTTWKCSKNYKRLTFQYIDLQRKIRIKRKMCYIRLSNYILSLGDNIFISDSYLKSSKDSEHNYKQLINILINKNENSNNKKSIKFVDHKYLKLINESIDSKFKISQNTSKNVEINKDKKLQILRVNPIKNIHNGVENINNKNYTVENSFYLSNFDFNKESNFEVINPNRLEKSFDTALFMFKELSKYSQAVVYIKESLNTNKNSNKTKNFKNTNKIGTTKTTNNTKNNNKTKNTGNTKNNNKTKNTGNTKNKSNSNLVGKNKTRKTNNSNVKSLKF